MTETTTKEPTCCQANCEKPWHARIDRNGTQTYVCEAHTPKTCVSCRRRPAAFGVGVTPVFCYVCEGGMEETLMYRADAEHTAAETKAHHGRAAKPSPTDPLLAGLAKRDQGEGGQRKKDEEWDEEWGAENAPVCGGVTHEQLVGTAPDEPGVGNGFEPDAVSGPLPFGPEGEPIEVPIIGGTMGPQQYWPQPPRRDPNLPRLPAAGVVDENRRMIKALREILELTHPECSVFSTSISTICSDNLSPLVNHFGDAEPTAAPTEDRMLTWFAYRHLPLHLQQTSKSFHTVAMYITDTVNPGPERTVALRKLLEAKDAAVRATLHPGG